jgi:hypothetical protein
MRQTLLTLATTAAVALGGLSVAPQPAHAVAWWVAPAIAGGVIAGAAVGAAAATNPYAGPNAAGHYAFVPPQPYDPSAPAVYARTTVVPSTCFWAREPIPGGWRRVRVCD